MKTLFAATLAMLLVGCGSTAALNSHGSRVGVVKSEPIDCQDLGTFYGSGSAPEYAMNNLLNVIGESGGNRAYLIRAEVVQRAPLSNTIAVLGNDNTIYGRGFNCTN